MDLDANANLFISSAFSGSGMVELCAHNLNQALGHRLFIPTVWIEKDQKAAGVLREIMPDAIGLGDILDLLPDDVRGRLSDEPADFDKLTSMLVHEAPCLNISLFSSGAECPESALLGHIHVAGVPRTDFSLMGKRQQTHGVTMQCFLVWIRLMVMVQPLYIVFENVRFSSISVLHDLLGHLYFIDDALLDPSRLGWPVRRVRRYVVMRAKRLGKADAVVGQFFSSLETGRRLPGRVLFAEARGEREVLQPGYSHRLSGYVAKYGSSASHLFDLSQNPCGRPRASKDGSPCMTLTTGSSHIYCPGEGRCLSGNELLLAQVTLAAFHLMTVSLRKETEWGC